MFARWDLSPARPPTGRSLPTATGDSSNRVLDFNSSAAWSGPRCSPRRHARAHDRRQRRAAVEHRIAPPVVRYSPHGAVASAAISPDGKLVATGSWDHSAKIWDADTGRAIRKLDGGHTGYINSVEFSPDGRELLTASDDGTARLWDVADRQADRTSCFAVTRPACISATYLARRLARSSRPAATRRLAFGTAPAASRADPPLKGHEWAVLCGQFSPDGQRVITGSQDNTAIIWDADTGEELLTLAGHTAAVTSVAFSPDGTRVLTGSQDNSVKLWDAATRARKFSRCPATRRKSLGELLARRPQCAHLQPRWHGHHLAGRRLAHG